MDRIAALLVEDDSDFSALLRDLLCHFPLDWKTARTLKEARESTLSNPPDLVFLDQRLPDGIGAEWVGDILAQRPSCQVILVTGYPSLELAVEVVQRGALDVLAKPLEISRLTLAVQRAINIVQQLRGDHTRRETLSATMPLDNLIGVDSNFLKTLEMAQRAARTNAAILIQGESGTGKECLARATHFASPRRSKPFVAFNCSAIPDSLVESELFGYKRGAFTDANSDREGLVVRGEGGTLFLDEVGDTSLIMQGKLLRFLEEKQYLPLGANRFQGADIRFIAATHQDLESLAKKGRFRMDFYYRINTLVLRLPPLRERPLDIVPLARHLLRQVCLTEKCPEPEVGRSAQARLRAHGWPGNIRELANVMQRAVLMSSGKMIRAGHLQLDDDGESYAGTAGLHGIEKKAIQAALQEKKGNISSAARLLGIGRGALRYRMKRMGIKKRLAENSQNGSNKP